MQLSLLLSAGVLASLSTVGLAAPAVAREDALPLPLLPRHGRRENLCSLPAPPEICQPDPAVTVEETARRAHDFYRAFVVDGDPRTMFSLIDSTYTQHHPGYASGPGAIWPLFCSGNKLGDEQNTAWCFDAATNMSYAQYSTTDRWLWVGGCVHEHWDQGERIPSSGCYELDTGTGTS